MKKLYIVFGTINIVLILLVLMYHMFPAVENIPQVKTINNNPLGIDGNFKLSENGYSGWQMGCNYTHGSDRDNQKYLDCANGLVYENIGNSTSVNYFNPNNKEVNFKYCKNDGIAQFSFPDPVTKEGGDRFTGCMKF